MACRDIYELSWCATTYLTKIYRNWVGLLVFSLVITIHQTVSWLSFIPHILYRLWSSRCSSFIVAQYPVPCSGMKNILVLMKSYLWVPNMGMEWMMSRTGYYQNFLVGQRIILRYVAQVFVLSLALLSLQTTNTESFYSPSVLSSWAIIIPF